MRCFIDTNILIHYKLFSEIDWNKDINETKIELVICPTVLQELDRMKYSELDLEIRNRCKKIIAKLSEFSSGDSIKENVTIHFLTNEPLIDWTSYNLSPDTADDRIIASILSEKRNHEIILISSDLGIKLKAQANHIKTLTLRDELLIQLKRDKKEEEINKLKQRLAYLENSSPKLALKILDDESLSNYKKYSYSIINPFDINIVNNIVEKLRSELKYSPPEYDSGNLLPQFSQMYFPSDEEIARYEKDVEKYLLDLKYYYEDEWEFKDTISRTFEIKLFLINEGSKPAEDIDIFIKFPDGFILFEKSDYPLPPKKPTEPDKPRSFSSLLHSLNMGQSITSQLVNPSLFMSQSHIISKGPDTSPTIKKTNSYEVKYKIDKLKHRLNIGLDPIYLNFENYNSIKSFSINYSILTGNHPEDFSGELNLIFSN